MNEFARRFGEQQNAPRLQDSVEFAQSIFLIDHVMEGLMAKDHINRAVGQPQTRTWGTLKCYLQVVPPRLLACCRDHSVIDVDRDQVLGPEAIAQHLQRKAPPAANIGDDRVGCLPIHN